MIVKGIDLCITKCRENYKRSRAKSQRQSQTVVFLSVLILVTYQFPPLHSTYIFPIQISRPKPTTYLWSLPLLCHSPFYPCASIDTFLDETDWWISVSHLKENVCEYCTEPGTLYGFYVEFSSYGEILCHKIHCGMVFFAPQFELLNLSFCNFIPDLKWLSKVGKFLDPCLEQFQQGIWIFLIFETLLHQQGVS